MTGANPVLKVQSEPSENMNTIKRLFVGVPAIVAGVLLGLGSPMLAAIAEPDFATVEMQFRELPREARQLTGPLFWLHGDDLLRHGLP